MRVTQEPTHHPMNATAETKTTASAPTKAQLIEELYRFARRRPGLDWRNYYSSWQDTSGRQAYASEVRAISRDFGDARQLIRAIDLRDGITAQDILAGLKRHYSARLSWDAETESLHYCPGQYWPTEYRKAVCAVCSGILWTWVGSTSRPAPDGADEYGSPTYGGLSGGSWLRAYFRREFGRGLASRWFN